MSELIEWYGKVEFQETFLSLSKQDRDFLIDYKYQVEANKMQIQRILSENHPRAQEFYDWVNINEKNKEWYLKNMNRIKLVPNGVEIFWDIYDLEDINPLENLSYIDEKMWSREDAEKYAKENWKEIPDWARVIWFLPVMTWFSFFIGVMKMQWLYLWSSCDTVSTNKNTITFWSVLASSWRLRLVNIKK